MKKLAITCGDPAGVGPEIIFAWLNQNPQWANRLCMIGPWSWLEKIADAFDVETLPVGKKDFKLVPGKPSEEGAKIAIEVLGIAAAGCRDGKYKAVATAPASKEWLQRVGFKYPGHTEFFAAQWQGNPSMGFVGNKLQLVLATWHIPLSEVPKALTRDQLLLTISRADWLAKKRGIVEPRIGVCGLNPHAGEGGILGQEEVTFINPLLDEARKKYPWLSSCQAADTLFLRMLQGEFDILIGLYHDQGLGPLKTLEFDQAVNVTLGLNWIRTSPDHGTGFAIAGQNKARFSSMGRAIELAWELS